MGIDDLNKKHKSRDIESTYLYIFFYMYIHIHKFTFIYTYLYIHQHSSYTGSLMGIDDLNKKYKSRDIEFKLAVRDSRITFSNTIEASLELARAVFEGMYMYMYIYTHTSIFICIYM
jgi:hypothetical protein